MRPLNAMKEKVAIFDTGYDSYAYEEKLFQDHGYELIVFKGRKDDLDGKTAFAGDACGILVRGTKVDAKAMGSMPRLRAIVRYGVGYDNIDIEYAASRGIRVANVQGYANHAVSDHALALMFASVRGLGGKFHPFGKPPRREMFEFHAKTLGIIGIGRIGSHMSGKASPLFRRTIACDPYQEEAYVRSHGAEKVTLEELLKESHVISLHCNLTEETRHLLDDSAFRKMAQAPVIINTARGPVIDEAALLDALNSGKIHSAGLDVFGTEPPGKEQGALMDHPHVVSTPHIAWYSDRAMGELQKRAADNMIGLLAGRILDDEIKPDPGS